MQLESGNIVHYSDLGARLTALLSQNPTMRSRTLELDTEDTVPFMRRYAFPLSAWPVIISQAQVEEFERFVERLPGLFFKAMKGMFNGDAEAFAAYLNESPLIYEMLMAPEFNTAQMLNRHDVLFSNGDLKLLEVNAGSSIGGWQPGLLERQFKQVLSEFPETAAWSVHHYRAADNIFLAVRAAILKLKQGNPRGNILMFCGQDEAVAAEALRMRHDQVLEDAKPEQMQDGQLLFFTDFAELEFADDGTVRFEGEEMDAVLLAGSVVGNVPKNAILQLVGAHLMGTIVMPDSVMYTIFGNKLLMALLHEPVMAELLSDEENDFIGRHIPFATRLQNDWVQWHGRNFRMADLLRERKNDLVVKKAHSFQGRDVYIGKYTSEHDWDDLIARLNGDADWLVQEYCAADSLRAPDSAGNLADYALVWGIFDTGNAYGGAFVRGMAAGHGRGVINSAQGAVEFPVFVESANEPLN